MTTATSTQTDLFAWAKDLERENKRIAEINAERVRNRGYLVFATDPSKGVDSAEYQQVYATEARTPNQAIAKVRPLAEGRRLQAFLTTGRGAGHEIEVVEHRDPEIRLQAGEQDRGEHALEAAAVEREHLETL